jgi:hypothetical protein
MTRTMLEQVGKGVVVTFFQFWKGKRMDSYEACVYAKSHFLLVIAFQWQTQQMEL